MKTLYSFLFIFFMAGSFLAQSTEVLFQNNTTLDFTFSTADSGGLGANWVGQSGTISKYERRKNVFSFDRNFGSSPAPAIFVISATLTSPGGSDIEFNVELTELNGATTFRHTASGPSFNHPWRSDIMTYDQDFTMNGANYLLRYQAYQVNGDDEILFSVYHETDPTYEIDPADLTNPDVANIMSYNIYMRPAILFPNDDQAVRAEYIHEYVHDLDALIIQEAFDNIPRETLLNKLATEYPYQSDVVDNPLNFLEDGGVLIVSRWPIEAEDQLLWGTTCNLDDCTANKGIKYVKINKNGTPYHLFGTHMDAFNELADVNVRKEQLIMFKNFVDDQNIPADEAVIMGGDFNIDKITNKYGEYDSLWSNFGGNLPDYQGYAQTWDSELNYYLIDATDPPEFLDYVINRKDHREALTAINEVLVLRSNHEQMWRKFDLSDHQPVLGRFEFAPPVGVFDPANMSTTVQFYPNPVTGSFDAHGTLAIQSQNHESLTIEVVDVMGRSIYTDQTVNHAGEVSISMDLSEWQTGVYILKVSGTKSGTQYLKIVRE